VNGGTRVVLRVACAGALAAALSPSAALAKNCEAWPGEPSPLPALADADPVRAEWAQLRVKELAQWARRAEQDDPLRARQMWRRVICLDPANDEALAGVQRALPVVVHRPALVDEPPAAARTADSFAALGAPLGLASSSAAREAQSQSEFRELRRAVSALEETVRTAQFEQALAKVPALRARLARAPAGGTRTSLTAQAEVLTATAELALGRADAADASLRRALEADPALALDPTTTAPKVLRALAAARAGDAR
jgi:tetratricopeptide (TPR) repeat protein